MPSISKAAKAAQVAWGQPPPAVLRSIAAPVLWRAMVLCPLLFLPAAVHSQQKQKPQPSTGMGVTTGAAHAAVKDSQHRPITAGGFVDKAPVVFIDATKEAGLDKFHHHSGTPDKVTILQFKRSGMAHHHDVGVMTDNLTRLGLLLQRSPSEGPDTVVMTTLGYEFVNLCQTHLKD